MCVLARCQHVYFLRARSNQHEIHKLFPTWWPQAAEHSRNSEFTQVRKAPEPAQEAPMRASLLLLIPRMKRSYRRRNRVYSDEEEAPLSPPPRPPRLRRRSPTPEASEDSPHSQHDPPNTHARPRSNEKTEQIRPMGNGDEGEEEVGDADEDAGPGIGVFSSFFGVHVTHTSLQAPPPVATKHAGLHKLHTLLCKPA